MMTSKLRRPPLFQYTSDPIYTSHYAAPCKADDRPPKPVPKLPSSSKDSKMVFPLIKKKHPLYSMEVGVASYNGVMRNRGEVGERSPGKGLHVNFSDKGEVKERREKFLTAKYGSHQMSLIRKRLAVEMWLYDELQKLYESADKKSPEVEVDIDELLDMDDDIQRRRHLQEILQDAKKSPHDVKKFVDDLLERTKTL